MKGRIRPWIRALKLLGAALLVCSTVTPAWPQGAAPTRTADSPETNASYRIGAGDALRVDVAGRDDLSGVFTVSAGGALVLPVIGSVHVESRTLPEIRTDLMRRVSLFDRTGPQVTVTIAEFKSRKVFVLGAVTLPGIYGFAEMPNVWDAIAEAGGPAEDADLGRVEIISGDARSERRSTAVDVAAAILGSRTESLPRLRPGDTVRVPRTAAGQITASTVLLFGAVMKPGPLPYDQAPDLATAVARSGGPTTDAKLSQVGIVRRSGTQLIHMSVNMNEYFTKASSAGNPNLEPGDTVFFPRKPHRSYAVLGVLTSVATLASTIVLLAR